MTTYDDSLIVGGSFTTAGGFPSNNIARWDGSAWSPLINGISGPVYAVGVYGDELIAAGEFTHAGGVPCNRIARWNGNSWQPLGGGIGATGRAIAMYGGELVAGGLFTQVDNDASSYWARWRPNCLRGDLDCDLQITEQDIIPFVQALLSAPALDACEGFTSDVNGDGLVDAADIAAFLPQLF
jgi:hypothetical protein